MNETVNGTRRGKRPTNSSGTLAPSPCPSSPIKKRLFKLLRIALIVCFWLAVWAAIYLIVGRDVVIASPFDVFYEIGSLLQQPDFYWSLLNSMRSIFIGFAVAMIVGIALAVISYIAPLVRELITPVISIMKAIPIACFIIAAFFFMNSSDLPILVAFLMVMPLVWANILEGLNSVDANLLEMSRVFGVPLTKQLKLVYLPASVPYFLAAFQTGFGYAWKSAITAEVMSSPKFTIGRHLADAKVYLDTLTLFSWTAVVIVASILTEKLLMYLLNKIFGRVFPKAPGEGGVPHD